MWHAPGYAPVARWPGGPVARLAAGGEAHPTHGLGRYSADTALFLRSRYAALFIVAAARQGRQCMSLSSYGIDTAVLACILSRLTECSSGWRKGPFE